MVAFVLGVVEGCRRALRDDDYATICAGQLERRIT